MIFIILDFIKKIIIYNNFQGVLILNLNFELIYEINFSKKILIYRIYRDYIIENKIILDCRELNPKKHSMHLVSCHLDCG